MLFINQSQEKNFPLNINKIMNHQSSSIHIFKLGQGVLSVILEFLQFNEILQIRQWCSLFNIKILGILQDNKTNLEKKIQQLRFEQDTICGQISDSQSSDEYLSFQNLCEEILVSFSQNLKGYRRIKVQIFFQYIYMKPNQSQIFKNCNQEQLLSDSFFRLYFSNNDFNPSSQVVKRWLDFYQKKLLQQTDHTKIIRYSTLIEHFQSLNSLHLNQIYQQKIACLKKSILESKFNAQVWKLKQLFK